MLSAVLVGRICTPWKYFFTQISAMYIGRLWDFFSQQASIFCFILWWKCCSIFLEGVVLSVLFSACTMRGSNVNGNRLYSMFPKCMQLFFQSSRLYRNEIYIFIFKLWTSFHKILKYLIPFSAIANIIQLGGVGILFGYFFFNKLWNRLITTFPGLVVWASYKDGTKPYISYIINCW